MVEFKFVKVITLSNIVNIVPTQNIYPQKGQMELALFFILSFHSKKDTILGLNSFNAFSAKTFSKERYRKYLMDSSP